MSLKLKFTFVLFALSILLIVWLGIRVFEELSKSASEDPTVWENDIVAFETAAQVSPPPENAVVFVGSSSIRLWDTLASDMAPIPVIQRGFGGAKLNDLVHYADRLVTAYRPSAVVVFAGSNDITPDDVKSPEQLLNSYQQFVARVRADNPELPIYYIAITPSPMRWEVWPSVQAANAAIKDYSESSSGLFYIDTGPALLNANGEPETDNYAFDTLHLSDKGYRVWTSIIRPVLLRDFPHA